MRRGGCLSTEVLDKELDSSLEIPPRITAEAVGGARASGKILADGRGRESMRSSRLGLVRRCGGVGYPRTESEESRDSDINVKASL